MHKDLLAQCAGGVKAQRVKYQELTATGAITPGVSFVGLNHASVVVAATLADLKEHEGFLVLADTSASGTAAHTVTVTTGALSGTSKVATFNAPGDLVIIYVDSTGQGHVVLNTGSVAFS